MPLPGQNLNTKKAKDATKTKQVNKHTPRQLYYYNPSHHFLKLLCTVYHQSFIPKNIRQRHCTPLVQLKFLLKSQLKLNSKKCYKTIKSYL